MDTIKELQRLNTQLGNLLAAPEPGLFYWWKAVDDVIKDITAINTPAGIANA